MSGASEHARKAAEEIVRRFTDADESWAKKFAEVIDRLAVSPAVEAEKHWYEKTRAQLTQAIADWKAERERADKLAVALKETARALEIAAHPETCRNHTIGTVEYVPGRGVPVPGWCDCGIERAAELARSALAHGGK